MSILNPLMELVECLDFNYEDAFKLLCDPILRWMFDEKHILQQLKCPSAELEISQLQILWDIVTNTLPVDKRSLQCYLKIPEKTYKLTGIKMSEFMND